MQKNDFSGKCYITDNLQFSKVKMAQGMNKVFKAINDYSENMEKTIIKGVKEYLEIKLTEDYDSEFVSAVSVLIDDYLANMPKAPALNVKDGGIKKEKKTRAPTEYNLFLKAKMAEIKEAGTDLKGKELMLAAITEWNKEKESRAIQVETDKIKDAPAPVPDTKGKPAKGKVAAKA